MSAPRRGIVGRAAAAVAGFAGAVGVAATVGAGALGCALWRSEPPSPAQVYEKQPDAVSRGRLIFNGTCGGYCHPTAPGNRDAPYLFGCSWRYGGSDAELFASISDGVPGTRMPGWSGKLPNGDDDIWKVIAYLRSRRDCGGGDGAPASDPGPGRAPGG
jgi:mono/diheme cytochrome c family protein